MSCTFLCKKVNKHRLRVHLIYALLPGICHFHFSSSAKRAKEEKSDENVFGFSAFLAAGRAVDAMQTKKVNLNNEALSDGAMRSRNASLAERPRPASADEGMWAISLRNWRSQSK